MEDVSDLELFSEEEQGPQVLHAPIITGTEAPETAGLLEQYRDWASRRPSREATDPSTGRKIVAGALGFLGGLVNPAAGGAITSGILEGPRRRAMKDWEEEGKALGTVGEFAQNVSETRRKREGDVLGWEGVQSRVEAQRAAIGQRKEAENLRHQDRMANITEDSNRRKEIERHNKELERIATEMNRIRAIEAKARKTSAEAYSSRVGALNERKGEKPNPAHYRAAIRDAISEMLPEYPDFQSYFVRHPSTKEVMVKPGLRLSPVDAQRFRAFLEDAKERAKRTYNLDDDVEDLNPFREEIP
jgi:hypothetical protein